MKQEKNEQQDSIATIANIANTSDARDVNVGEDQLKANKTNSRYTKRPPNERRFKCDECERMFFTRKDVKRHMVVHTGVRNFACPYCQQRFGRKDHLVRHAKKSHNRDTRTSASYTVSTSGNRRGTYAHRQSTAPVTAVAMHNTSPPQGDSLSHSPCNFSNVSSPLEQQSFLLLGSSNGHNSAVCCNPNNVSSAPLPQLAICDVNYASTGGMPPIDENPIAKHVSGCEPMYNNGTPHYFSFPMSAPPPFMGPTYISSGFVPNPSSNMCTNNGGPHPHPVGGVCGEHSVINTPTFVAHDVSSSLPHFNQIFQ